MGKLKSLPFLIFINCLLPLFIGAFVYMFFRPVFYVNMPKIAVQQPWLKQFFFTLPDFCWSYSLTFALYLFSIYYRLWAKAAPFIILFLLLFSESIQVLLPDRFTFDIWDLVATFLACILAIIQIKYHAFKKES